MMSCREVAEGIASDRFENAGPLTRLGLRLHLLICHVCRRYARQIRAVGADTKCMCDQRQALGEARRTALAERCIEASSPNLGMATGTPPDRRATEPDDGD